MFMTDWIRWLTELMGKALRVVYRTYIMYEQAAMIHVSESNRVNALQKCAMFTLLKQHFILVFFFLKVQGIN